MVGLFWIRLIIITIKGRYIGKVYSVGIEIHSPTGKIRVHQGQHDNHTHEDLYITIRDAFNVAERQLKAASKKHRIITPNRGRLHVKAA